MLPFEIRPVWLEAAALVAVLHSSCFPDESWDEAAVAEIMGMPGAFGALAVRGWTPLGFVLAVSLPEECEILSLGVSVERRREGAGRALLGHVLDRARGKSGGVVLEVAEDNPAAQRLYAEAGFVQVGRRRDYYNRPGGGSAAALVLRCRGNDLSG